MKKLTTDNTIHFRYLDHTNNSILFDKANKIYRDPEGYLFYKIKVKGNYLGPLLTCNLEFYQKVLLTLED